jgi:hypothetical protein
MGAKFTIILDTDDTQGLKDALEVATLLHKRHVGRPHGVGHRLGEQVHLSKIPMIKLVRMVAKQVEAGKMDSSLRDCKQLVDSLWPAMMAGRVDVG